MLFQDELTFLNKIDPNKKVTVKPYNKKMADIANNIINEIHLADPNANIVHLGSSALKISGQNDIDIFVLSSRKNFSNHVDKLSRAFGDPLDKIDFYCWMCSEDGYDIEIHLTDPNDEKTARQLKVYNLLANNPELLNEYEIMKIASAKNSYLDYQKQKYEFYHKILHE